FLAAPLLLPPPKGDDPQTSRRGRQVARMVGVNAAILVALSAGAFALRHWTGENRVAHQLESATAVLSKVIRGFSIGPRVALTRCAIRAADLFHRTTATPARI